MVSKFVDGNLPLKIDILMMMRSNLGEFHEKKITSNDGVSSWLCAKLRNFTPFV